MKTRVFTGILLITATMGFAQGKVRFENDSLHLVYLTTDTVWLFDADFPLAGQAIPAGGVLPSGLTLVAELWAGTSSSSLQHITTTTFSSSGRWNAVNVSTVPFLGVGFFQVQVQVYGATNPYPPYPPYSLDESPIFTCTASSGAMYNSIVNLGSPSFSTWGVGTYPLDSVMPGAKGAISIGLLAPHIMAQPSSLTVAVGDLAYLSVLASDADYYQWRRNGTSIPGATSSVYSIGPAQLTDTGGYSVAVANEICLEHPVISSAAGVQVVPPGTNWWALQRTETDLVLGWITSWVLQDATNVLGPFHDVPRAMSPYATNLLLHPQLFFRWRQ